MVIISHYHERNCRICISLVFVSLMFWAQANTVGAGSNAILRDKNRDKEVVWAYKVVEAVGNIGSLQREPKLLVEQTERELANLINVSKDVGPEWSEYLLLYKAACLKDLGKKQEASSIIDKGIKGNLDTPDFLLLRLHIVGEGGGKTGLEARIKFWEERGRILPLSIDGRDRDYRRSQVLVKVNPPPPSVPILSDIGTRLAEIGELYEKMGFKRDAINSYVEALYSSPFAETGEKRGDICLKIAKLEEQQGQKVLALRAYLKAAYSHEKYAEPAQKGIERIINEPKVRKKPTTSPAIGKRPATKPTLDKKTVLRIVALYRKMNLHPLALSLIVRTEKETEATLSKEKETIRKEWQDVVKRIARVRGPNCHILGHKVSDIKDWAQIRVLRPSDSFWKPMVPTTPKQKSKIKRDSK